MRKLKNSHKILSLLLLGIFLISIIILPNNNIVSENNIYDNSPIFPSEQTDQYFDNIFDNTPPQLSAPAKKYNQTFSISQSEDDADSHAFAFAKPYTNCDATNITLGGVSKYDPYSAVSMGIALRWDITVPKYATITKAYINLTVANLTSGGMPWTGFNTSISAFEEASTNDFSRPGEILKNNRTLRGDVLWELDGTELINQTLQTVDISELLQQIMALDGWDGKFGAFTQSGIGTDYDFSNPSLPLLEIIQFWAYDYGNPEYYPKLFVEWENIPRFIETPEDMYVFENTSGFSVKWQVWDDDPDSFKLTCNISITNIPDYNNWTSGWVIYDLPALKRGFYNFTGYFNDTDGNLIWDSVIVEAGPAQMTYKIERKSDDAWYRPLQGAAFADYGPNLQLGGSTIIHNSAQRVTCLRFNTAIPKHVHIKRAYINLTVSSLANYNGFTSQIYLFYPPVADFTDDNDFFTLYWDWRETRHSNRDSPVGGLLPKRLPLEWSLPISVSQGITIQTPNFKPYLQQLIDFPNYNGYIGLYIIPTAGIDSVNEKVNFYSYDFGNPENTPTLFVEWEETPYFMSTPADVIAKNGTRGYYLEWTATDDNPTTFTITCNDTVSNIPPGSIIYSGVWQSGIETSYNMIYDNDFRYKFDNITTKIRYDIPPLDIGVYNFTIRITDAYGNYNLDSVIVKVIDLDLPVIDVKFVQKGEEVNYFQCGNDPFKIRIYNSTEIDPGVWLTAYYPGYNQDVYSTAMGGNFDSTYPVLTHLTGDTTSIIKFEDEPAISYNSVLGCYELECPSNSEYSWKLVKLQNVLVKQFITVSKEINNIEYNVLNRFQIRIDGNAEYIYNQTIYGDRWTRPLEVWNKDLTPPTYSEPEFIEPDNPDEHYKVNIWAVSEEFGAQIYDVILYYSVDDGPWEETEMILHDGWYYGEIPAQEEGATIDYYIRITDEAGNLIETDEYHKKAPTFEEPSIIIPIVGILLGILGSLSIVAIYRHKRKAAFKKLTSEKKIIKVKK